MEVERSVAGVPPVELLMVIWFDPLPSATKWLTVVMVLAGKVMVFGLLTVMVLNVLAPVMMTAPVPPPVTERLL